MKYVTYSRECGFNIVEAKDEQEAEMLSDSICLNNINEFDEVILKRIKELLKA
ncbi:hypothetical protein GF336_00275 [Candidatus Woesearchaeota archaeon]|nr:hypothetical protein [Candidatus Woesearchaeota archaeon]